jgi:hypothetical protein
MGWVSCSVRSCQAVERRRRAHLAKKPKAWLAPMVRCSLVAEPVASPPLPLLEALALEALEAALAWRRSELHARGGPWVLPTLGEGEAELRKVVAALPARGRSEQLAALRATARTFVSSLAPSASHARSCMNTRARAPRADRPARAKPPAYQSTASCTCALARAL